MAKLSLTKSGRTDKFRYVAASDFTILSIKRDETYETPYTDLTSLVRY